MNIDPYSVAGYDRRIILALARTWSDDDPAVTESVRLAASHLGMLPGEVHRILEVWELCAERLMDCRDRGTS